MSGLERAGATGVPLAGRAARVQVATGVLIRLHLAGEEGAGPGGGQGGAFIRPSQQSVSYTPASAFFSLSAQVVREQKKQLYRRVFRPGKAIWLCGNRRQMGSDRAAFLSFVSLCPGETWGGLNLSVLFFVRERVEMAWELVHRMSPLGGCQKLRDLGCENGRGAACGAPGEASSSSEVKT